MKRTAVRHRNPWFLAVACAVGSSVLIASAASAGERVGGETAKSEIKKVAASAPDYARDVAPLFRKYCLGCHNAQEAQGGLVLETYTQSLHGGEHGAIVLAGNAEKSRLILVLEKRIEPAMPPEGNKGPSAAEIGILKSWIQAGAHGPAANSTAVAEIVAPKIEPVGKARNPDRRRRVFSRRTLDCGRAVRLCRNPLGPSTNFAGFGKLCVRQTSPLEDAVGNRRERERRRLLDRRHLAVCGGRRGGPLRPTVPVEHGRLEPAADLARSSRCSLGSRVEPRRQNRRDGEL